MNIFTNTIRKIVPFGLALLLGVVAQLGLTNTASAQFGKTVPVTVKNNYPYQVDLFLVQGQGKEIFGDRLKPMESKTYPSLVVGSQFNYKVKVPMGAAGGSFKVLDQNGQTVNIGRPKAQQPVQPKANGLRTTVKNNFPYRVDLYLVHANGKETFGDSLKPMETKTYPLVIGSRWKYKVNLPRGGAGGMFVIFQNGQTINIGEAKKGVVPPINPGILPTMNKRVLEYAKSKIGKYVGNGQCWTFANEALKAVGGKQPFVHYKGQIDTFGLKLRGVQQVRPGDILQMHNVRFSNGIGTSRHTAIITGVKGTVLTVLEQNVAGSPVQYGTLDVSTLTQGRIDYFRPQAINNGGFTQ